MLPTTYAIIRCALEADPTVSPTDRAHLLAGLRNNAEVDDVLAALLTPREREKIALRWKLVRMLEAGLTQRAIAEQLGVSLCKITRGSRELKTGRAGFRRIVRRSMVQQAGGT